MNLSVTSSEVGNLSKFLDAIYSSEALQQEIEIFSQLNKPQIATEKQSENPSFPEPLDGDNYGSGNAGSKETKALQAIGSRQVLPPNPPIATENILELLNAEL